MLAVLVLGVLAGSAGCQGCQGRSEPGARRPIKKPRADPRAPESLRAGHHVVRSLVHETSRMELWRGGLLINLGTPDQHKYTRGGWRSGWHAPGRRGLFAGAGRVARLELVHRGNSKEIVVRARSALGGQMLTLKLDGRVVATRRLGKGWSEPRFPLYKQLSPGRHELVLSFARRNKTGTGPVAEVDWVWLPRGTGQSPRTAAKRAVVVMDGPRNALVADPPRRLSHHLRVPRRTALVFDVGAARSTEFELQITVDGQQPRTLYSSTASGSKWKEARVDLSSYGGKLVRLDFVTRGEGGKAGWAEPDLIRAGKAPAAPVVLPASRAKNLIHILIDTARQDVYSPFNPKTHVRAPAMARVAKDSVVFRNAYTNDNWTKPSVATLLSGLYSSTHRTQGERSVVPKTATFLSEHLRKLGFDTAAFIANGYTSGKFGFNKGWNAYRNYFRPRRPYDAEYVYGDALAWLKKPRKGRFFLYIQTIDPHVPYAVPHRFLKLYYKKRYRGRLGPSVTGYETKDFLDGKIRLSAEDRRYIRALYDAEVTYHDEQMGKFLDRLKEMGLLEDTLLVVSNDHGEEMFEHGKTGHRHSLYDELLRCPLLLRYPGLLPAGRRIDAVVGLVDVLPTVIELMGVPPMKHIEGRSLLPTVAGLAPRGGHYAVAEFLGHSRAVRLGPYKMIVSGSRTTLFNVADDPSEQADVAASRPIARRACEVHLYEALAVPARHRRLTTVGGKRPRHEAATTEIDPDLKKQLEALGYIND